MGSEKAICLLLVDDNHVLRAALRDALIRRGYAVCDVATGEEAVALVTREPMRFEFALIDQVLAKPTFKKGAQRRMDGIETARAVSRTNSDIGIIVFSGNPAAKSEDLRRAISAGTHRYFFKDGGIDALQDIQQFVAHMSVIRELKQKLAQFYEDRSKLGCILSTLDTGITLIDATYRVWYVNDKFKQIVGKHDVTDDFCYLLFHGYETGPCDGCIVQRALEGGISSDRYYFSPVGNGKLKYLHVQARPVKSDLGENIAAVESVIDLTGSGVIEEMEPIQRLRIVAQAITERGYQRALVYRAMDNGTCLVGTFKVGETAVPFEDAFIVDMASDPYKSAALEAKEPRLWGGTEHGPIPYADKLPKHGPWIDLPLFCQGRLTGWLEVDNKKSRRPLSIDDVGLIQPYADEVALVLGKPVSRLGGPTLPHEPRLEDVQLRLSASNTPEEALAILAEEAVKQTGADMAHIRIREGETARLVAFHGQYGSRAASEVNPDSADSWTGQVMRSGTAIIVDEVGVGPRKTALVHSLPPHDPLIHKIRSCAVFPLDFEGQPLGAIHVHSFKRRHFDQAAQSLLRTMAQLAGRAIRDYQMVQEREKAASVAAHLDMAFRTVHNLRTPTQAVRNYLDALAEWLEAEGKRAAGALAIAQKADAQLERIEKLASDILRLLRPLSLRLEPTDFDDLVSRTVRDLVAAETGVRSRFELAAAVSTINIDGDSIKEVLEQLVSNALNAVEKRKARQITVRTRLATPEDVHRFGGKPGEGYVVTSVCDTGSGVPPEIRDRLFQEWVSSSPVGSGLGLAVVKRIVTEHGGGVWLEATGPKGTTFAFALPTGLQSEGEHK